MISVQRGFGEFFLGVGRVDTPDAGGRSRATDSVVGAGASGGGEAGGAADGDACSTATAGATVVITRDAPVSAAEAAGDTMPRSSLTSVEAAVPSRCSACPGGAALGSDNHHQLKAAVAVNASPASSSHTIPGGSARRATVGGAPASGATRCNGGNGLSNGGGLRGGTVASSATAGVASSGVGAVGISLDLRARERRSSTPSSVRICAALCGRSSGRTASA